MDTIYPLKFVSQYKEKIWGGKRLRSVLGKDYGDLPNCGESWEISGVAGNVSEVAEGPLSGWTLDRLIERYQGQLVGERIYKQFGEEFPLLIKFIDAAEDLSVQVHPDDKLAKERHNGFGKSEMWYVFHADQDASLISGFSRELTEADYQKAFDEGKLDEVLNRVPVFAGDVFYIPAGRVHTIGKGILLTEIQQTSDLTYRIFDFDRKDALGNGRELHLEQALDAMDYTYHPEVKSPYTDQVNSAVSVVESPFFSTHKIVADQPVIRDHVGLDSFKIYICFEGSASLLCGGTTVLIKKGEAVLVPAFFETVQVIPKEKVGMLETFLPKASTQQSDQREPKA